MIRILSMIAAVSMLCATSGTSYAAGATAPYKLNAAGKCVGANGQFAAASLCKAPAATKCRDKTTKKFVKCGSPNSEPVPSKP